MSYTSKLSLLFVFLWSTAYIAFEFCASYAEPATFILIRVSLVALVFLIIIVVIKPSWPRHWETVFHSAVVGILIHVVYAGGSFASIYHGMPVAYCALVLCLQPLVTTVLSCCFLGENITTRKLAGIATGTTGVALLVLQGQTDTLITWSDAYGKNAAEISIRAVFLCVMSLFAFSVATIYQKRFCGSTPILSGGFIQYSSAALFILPFALIFESRQIEWNIYFGFSLAWLVVFISVGAVSVLMQLIKMQETSSVANIFFLVTPLVSIQAWIFFGETLSAMSVAGMLLCIAGVAVTCYSGTSFKSNQLVQGAAKAQQVPRDMQLEHGTKS